MKQLIFLFFLVFSSLIYSQEESLVGKWKVVEVKGKEFFIDVKKDTIIVSDKLKKWYPTKIGMQNEIASIRSNHFHKIFVFTDKNEFFDYMFLESKKPVFTGNYFIQSKNKLKLDVVNIAQTKLKKEAEFYFKKNLLYLKMHTETNSPIEYVLEKIQ